MVETGEAECFAVDWTGGGSGTSFLVLFTFRRTLLIRFLCSGNHICKPKDQRSAVIGILALALTMSGFLGLVLDQD